MHTSDPYRPPCNGWGRPFSMGGCFQNWRRSEHDTPRYINTTALAVGGVPSPRSTGPWGRTEFAADCATGEIRLDLNCYAAATDCSTSNLARCQKAGHVGVQARKAWHGDYAYREPDRDTTNCDMGSTPPSVKYLSRSFSIAVHGVMTQNSLLDGDGNTRVDRRTYDLTITQTVTVDRFSGITSVGPGCVVSETDVSDHSINGGAWVVDASPSLISTDVVGLHFASDSWLSTWENLDLNCHDTLSGTSPSNQFPTCTPSTIQAAFQTLYPDVSGLIYPGTDDGSTHESSTTASASVTDTSFTISLSQSASYSPDNAPGGIPATPPYVTGAASTSTAEITFSQGTAYSDTDFRGDCVELLAQWDMRKMPFRTDASLTVYPLVTRDEYATPVKPPNGPIACDYVDAADPSVNPDSGYTGAILGAPFTAGWPDAMSDEVTADPLTVGANTADTYSLTPDGIIVTEIVSVLRYDAGDTLQATGVDGTDYTVNPCSHAITFHAAGNMVTGALSTDHRVVTYKYRSIAGGHFAFRQITRLWTSGSAYTTYYGAWSGNPGGAVTNGYMPHTATQWTVNDEAANLPAGAWQFMSAGDGVLFMQKAAYTKLPWRSQNWFGPCGADRDVLVGGVNLWPDAWPIEGDRRVTGSTDNLDGTITVTMDSAAAYLRVGDSIEFTTTAGEVVGSAESVTAVGASSFTYTGSLPGGTATRVKSAGAPAYWWYDTDGKGEFLSIEHQFDYRSVVLDPSLRLGQQTEYGMDQNVSAYTIAQQWLPFDRCNPAVAAFSPNRVVGGIDDFDNGLVMAFPAFTPDQRCGARWQGIFLQAIPDWWKVAGDDDGGCTGTTPKMMVEARLGCPAAWVTGDTAPTTQTVGTGLTQVYPSYITDITTSGQHGTVITPAANVGLVSPPGLPADVADIWAPWGMWLRMQACICGGGSFADQYKAVLGCWKCEPDP